MKFEFHAESWHPIPSYSPSHVISHFSLCVLGVFLSL